MTTRRKATIAKYGGNDRHSWAVFVDKQVVRGLTGLGRAEAQYHRDQVNRRLAETDAPTTEPTREHQ